MLTRILLSVAIGAPIFAQAPAPAEQKTATVEGAVTNALTGEPLRRAHVTLRPAALGRGGMAGPGPMVRSTPGIAAATDASGKFSFSGVQPGRYMLTAERNGYLRADYGAKRQGQAGTPLEVGAGSVMKDLTLKLTPQGIVAGRIFDEEGEPLQGVFVQLLQKRYLRESPRWLPVGANQTNDRGEFRLLDVAPGKYVLMARYMRGGAASMDSDGASEMGYAPTFYPGGTAAGQAGTVTVAAGRESGGLDMRLQRSRVFRISGQVVDPSGGGARRASIQVQARDNPFLSGTGTAMTREDGRFEVANVAPGSYTLIARAMDGGREAPPLTAYQAVEVGEHNVEGLTIPLVPGMAVNGKVTVEGGGTVKLDGVRVVLIPSLMPMAGAFGNPKADGSFTLPNVAPGKYRLSVTQTGDAGYLKSVKAGGQDLADGELEIPAGGAPEIAVTISTAAGRVSGTVNGKDGAVAQATVVLAGENAKAIDGAFKTATSGQDGSFTLAGLAPGEYKLYAWEDVESGAWQDPEFLKPYETRAATVKVQPNGTASVNLEVIPAGQ